MPGMVKNICFAAGEPFFIDFAELSKYVMEDKYG
jgi:hypothetical protein